MSSSGDGDAIWVCLFAGPMLLASGWRLFKRKRLMQNTPSSKVRSAAMGLVELNGQALPRRIQIAPVSQTACCWWRCVVEEYRSSGKRSRWVTLKDTQSLELFFLEDATGRVLIDPSQAEFHVSEAISGIERMNGARIAELLTAWGITATGLFGGFRRIRIREQVIPDKGAIYVMGELTHRTRALDDRRERLAARLRAAKSDRDTMAQVDKNKDGTIDAQEWDSFRLEAERALIAGEQAAAAAAPADERLVVRAPEGGVFIISTHGEEALVSRFAWTAPFQIFGGIGLSVLGVYLALAQGWNPTLIVLLLSIALLVGSFLKVKGALTWVWR